MPYIYKTGRTELYAQIKRHTEIVSGRVLDIGAGNFSRYRDLFTCTEYVRMDIRPGKNVDVVGQIEQIPFPNDSFDSVICTQVLGDVYELAKAFSELYRILQPKGVALITESLFDPLHDVPNDFWRFTGHSLSRLAEDAGFKIEVLERRGGYHSVLAQLKARYWIERLQVHQKWYARLLSFWLKFWGQWAIRRDQHDPSSAAKLFTQGYLLIIRKHA